MTPRQLVKSLRNLSLPNTFNPYADRCGIHDRSNAPELRRSLLTNMLEQAVSTRVEALWIGRDLGYRGGRRTGMALTDDVRLQRHAARWNLDVQRPTKGPVVRERTADMVWAILAQIDTPVFLWNVFPLHPHEPGEPFTNRRHTAQERDIGEGILLELIKLLHPERVIAIGKDASISAARVFPPNGVSRARHPSYGGQRDFANALESLYRLPSTTRKA